MKRIKFLRGLLLVVTAGLALSCSSQKKTDDTKKSLDSIAAVNADSTSSENDSIAEGQSLNDIRFADFSDEDWLDNEYIRTLRRYIDDFNSGKVEDEELEPYRNDVEGKFVIANVEPFLLGGLFVQIIFVDKPENIFTAWVYSDVDKDAEKVVGYNVRRISLGKEKNELTKDEIFEEMKKHPELKLW